MGQECSFGEAYRNEGSFSIDCEQLRDITADSGGFVLEKIADFMQEEPGPGTGTTMKKKGDYICRSKRALR
jgi:hypothetical protein